MTENTSIADSLAQTRASIGRFEAAYEREPGSVSLLAVSKRKPVSAIKAASEAGQVAFGENYVEEGLEKIAGLGKTDFEWHFIGAIQSRKTAMIAENFDWAHGIDRLKIARRLSDQRPASLPPLNVCIQVNLDNEEGKAGIPLQDVAELVQACDGLEGIRLRGLMAIPMPRHDLLEQRRSFARLRQSLQELSPQMPDLRTLSMGMSGDLEAAIAEGATIVRVGTAIFGSRD
ncbi:MAG: YggS family pyridoxal phosphate-dependent enzyme [Granulosicoccus sp.]